MKVGITGGIGSGKSYVCRVLRGLGYQVYDCDGAAKKIMVENAAVRDALKRIVGDDAYTAEGLVNKCAIAAFLFADTANAQAINAVVHPAVREDFHVWAEGKPLCFMESAILFESGFDALVDICVQVTAPLDLRISRTMQRDGLEEQDVRKRIAAQMPDEAVRQRCDFVIRNDEQTDLKIKIEEMLRVLQP